MARGWDSNPTPPAVDWLPEDLRHGQMMTGRQEADVDPIAYREVVVRRLLDRGVRPLTLTTLLPDWQTLILAVANDTAGDEHHD